MSDDIAIRELATHDEYEACVELQRDTWGREFNDTVPGSILHVSQRLGGVAAGAFDRAGQLLGFVFGMTGVENGAIVHWSDMLAVRPDARNLGLGRRLKEFQRASVARVGARVIYWTFDPLVARNAHLNFNVFGVHVVEYVRDMYGDTTGSQLHAGIGTDRLIVAWPVDDEVLARRKREVAAARESDAFESAPILGEPPGVAPRDLAEVMQLRIIVPPDITVLQASSASTASRWRASTRTAFEAAFEHGFVVAGFRLDTARGCGFYLLRRAPDEAHRVNRQTVTPSNGYE